jgi:cell division protein FtsI (penicillin-binding protein 3)
VKKRIILAFSGVCFLWVILLSRAFFIQVFPSEKLTALKQRQYQTYVKLEGRRGAIMDRNGRELALSTPAYSLFADPKLIEKKKTTSSFLAKELGVSFESIYAKIKDKNKRFVWIQRRLTKEKSDKIKAMGIKGLAFVEEWKRVYPNESLLASTLGFVGQEGSGLEGIELQYEDILHGNTQKLNVRRDARGRPLVTEGMIFADNPDGHDMKLTIDAEIQYTLENELLAAVRKFEANSAMGIVLDAQTSAIRAIASVPTFDANDAQKINPEHRKNHAITDAFEPGSTLKTLVLAAAMREKQLQPNSKYFCENGAFKIGSKTIHEADAHHHFGWLTASEILAYSSNIGTTKVAFQLGAEKLRAALLDFGLSQKSGVEVPGEARGVVQNLPWGDHLLSNISFGHGVSVSALQLANAYAVIANGGTLNKPYIVESVRNAETGEVTEFKPEKIRQVLSPEHAANMRLMLASVTNFGTGVSARVNGFIVGGKTGTAQKADPNAKGYMKGAYVSSFAGFIPAGDPRFVIYVVVDQPRKAYYGSEVAAPIFSKVASFAARKEGLAPTLLSEGALPLKAKVAKKVLPKPEVSSVRTLQEISEKGETKTLAEVPSLKGKSLREVIQELGGKDIKMRVQGQGLVSETFPAEGQPLSEGGELSIILK